MGAKARVSERVLKERELKKEIERKNVVKEFTMLEKLEWMKNIIEFCSVDNEEDYLMKQECFKILDELKTKTLVTRIEKARMLGYDIDKNLAIVSDGDDTYCVQLNDSYNDEDKNELVELFSMIRNNELDAKRYTVYCTIENNKVIYLEY